MPNNLFISYDLHSPGQNYEEVADAIKKLGNWAKVQYSLWYVKSHLSASDAGEKVWAVMDSNDSLIVIDVTDNFASWYNLSPEVSEFMKSHWN
ncbi:MAG: hypothetical protein K9N21_20335 [Deltaproteobacteria bacterium]|nr:hypothetical protein [Deltaproteobacteria bacterium]